MQLSRFTIAHINHLMVALNETEHCTAIQYLVNKKEKYATFDMTQLSLIPICFKKKSLQKKWKNWTGKKSNYLR